MRESWSGHKTWIRFVLRTRGLSSATSLCTATHDVYAQEPYAHAVSLYLNSLLSRARWRSVGQGLECVHAVALALACSNAPHCR